MASIASQMPTANVTIITSDIPATQTESLVDDKIYIFTLTCFAVGLKDGNAE